MSLPFAVGAQMTEIALSIAGGCRPVLLPRLVSSNQNQYGIIGAVFALQSWLVVLASLIVAAALLGAFAAESGGLIGRWTRGSDDIASWHRTPTGVLARRNKRPATTASRRRLRVREQGDCDQDHP